MKSLALNENHDISINVNGDFNFVEDIDETTQSIKTRLFFFFSEWPWDIKIGVPWYEQIFIKNYDKSLIESVLIKEILETDNVLELFNFDVNINNINRSLQLNNLIIRTNFGLINTDISI